MGKISELESAVRAMRTNAKNIIEIADAIEKGMFTEKTETPKENTRQRAQSDVAAEKEATAAEPVKEVTLSEVKAVLMEKSKAGFDHEVHELIKSYDVPKLSAIDKAHYPELLEKAKVIGNAK